MFDCEEFQAGGINEYLDFLRRQAYEKQIPFKGVFELTPRCNFNCKFCYVHLHPHQIPAQGRELTTEEWLSLGRAAQQAGMLELTLTGGEPFVRPDFLELYEAFHDMGFLIQIFSNGGLVDQKVVERLKERPPHAVRFTLYGASPETYDRVCGDPDGFYRVREAVDLLREAGIPVYLVTTLCKENIGDADAIYAFARQRGLPIIHTTSLVNPVRGASGDARSLQIPLEMPQEPVQQKLREENRGKYPRPEKEGLLDRCGNYRKGFWVTWNGNMQLCAFLSSPAVPVRGDTFEASWKSLLEELEKLNQPAQCTGCSYRRYCDRCPGLLSGAAGENGRISPEFCEKAKMNYIIFHGPQEEGSRG